MAVILKNGAVFLHVPKTGGTWVTNALRKAGLVRCSIGHRHANWPHLLAPGWQGLGRRMEYSWKRVMWLHTRPRPFTFCFVRHPLNWYESFYAYKQGLDWERDGDAVSLDRWHPNAVLNGLGQGLSFNEFVEEVHRRFPGYVSALYSHYTFHPVDYVGKQENLADDLVSVLGEMSLDCDAETIRSTVPVNRSRREGERFEWDPVLRQKVSESEAPALRRFGYS